MQLSSVVLPEPVPPEISTLQRQRPITCSTRAASGLMEPNLTRSSRVSLSFLNLRMVSVGPSNDSGGPITLTRLPSRRRASQMGEDSSTRRPTRLTMRREIFINGGFVREREVG